MVAINHVLCAYVQVFIILSIILFFKLHRGTWSPWSFQTLTGIWPYCKMAFSTTVSMCAEWLVFFLFFPPSSSPLPPFLFLFSCSPSFLFPISSSSLSLPHSLFYLPLAGLPYYFIPPLPLCIEIVII